MQRSSATDTGRRAKKIWDKSAYTVVADNMKGFVTTASSNNYEQANVASNMCYGKDVDPCESRFVDKFRARKQIS